MNVTDLKSAWNLLETDIIRNDTVKEDTIITSVHSQSRSEISKIKRGLQIKFFVASVSAMGASALAILSILYPVLNPLDAFFSQNESALFFGVMAITISVVVYFNYQAYKHIEAVQSSALNLKQNLQYFIDAMERAITFNIYSDTFITPVIFTWAYYAYAFENQSWGYDLRTALLLILPICIGTVSYIIQKVTQKLKFGKYLTRLNEYIDSL